MGYKSRKYRLGYEALQSSKLLSFQESAMGTTCESIMRGFEEPMAHRKGRLKLKTTAIEIVPPHGEATEAEPSGDQVSAKPAD